MISVCLVNVDYYMSYPIRDLDISYSEFRGAEVRQVPVIQIFGTTSTGKKTCLHIHGVLPYIYIPYDGTDSVEKLSYKIAIELDKALNISLGQASSNVQHINNVVLVSGIPIYGYHEREHQFFKIFFYNPGIVKKACSLLENGAILGKCFQPHEAHINYILQFMIDYNLHGMSFINLSNVKYRFDQENPKNLENIPLHLILPSNVQKRSLSQIELDASASDILNRQEIISGKLSVNPGLAALWDEEKQRRRNNEMDSQISFCLTQNRTKIKSTSTHQYFKKILYDKLKNRKTTDDTIDPNLSVYPAETPDSSHILSATSAHSSNETTILDDTIIDGSQKSVDLNDTIMPLYEILCDLKEDNRIEEDSVLSQQVKEPEIDELSESSEEEMNLSLALKKDNEDETEWNNSFWQDIRISQVDGNDDTDEEITFWGAKDDSELNISTLVPTSDEETEDSEEEKYEKALKCVLGSKKTEFYRDQKYLPFLDETKKGNITKSYSKGVTQEKCTKYNSLNVKKQIKDKNKCNTLKTFSKNDQCDLLQENKSCEELVKKPIQERNKNVRCYERNKCRLLKNKSKIDIKKCRSLENYTKKDCLNFGYDKVDVQKNYNGDNIKLLVSQVNEIKNTEVLEILNDFSAIEPKNNESNSTNNINGTIKRDAISNSLENNSRIQDIQLHQSKNEDKYNKNNKILPIPKRFSYCKKYIFKDIYPQIDSNTDMSDSDTNITYSISDKLKQFSTDETLKNSHDLMTTSSPEAKQHRKRFLSESSGTSDSESDYSDNLKLYHTKSYLDKVYVQHDVNKSCYDCPQIMPSYSYKYGNTENPTLNVMCKWNWKNKKHNASDSTELLDASKVYITPSGSESDQSLHSETSNQVLKPGRSILKINRRKKSYNGEKIMVLSDVRVHTKKNSLVTWNIDKGNVSVNVQNFDEKPINERLEMLSNADNFLRCSTPVNSSDSSFDFNREIDGVYNKFSDSSGNSWTAKTDTLLDDPSPKSVILKDVNLGSDCNSMYHEIQELCSTDLNKLKPKSTFLESSESLEQTKNLTKFRNLESPLDGSFNLDFDVGMDVCVPMSSVLQDVSTQTCLDAQKSNQKIESPKRTIQTLMYITQPILEIKKDRIQNEPNNCENVAQNISISNNSINYSNYLNNTIDIPIKLNSVEEHKETNNNTLQQNFGIHNLSEINLINTTPVIKIRKRRVYQNKKNKIQKNDSINLNIDQNISEVTLENNSLLTSSQHCTELPERKLENSCKVLKMNNRNKNKIIKNKGKNKSNIKEFYEHASNLLSDTENSNLISIKTIDNGSDKNDTQNCSSKVLAQKKLAEILRNFKNRHPENVNKKVIKNYGRAKNSKNNTQINVNSTKNRKSPIKNNDVTLNEEKKERKLQINHKILEKIHSRILDSLKPINNQIYDTETQKNPTCTIMENLEINPINSRVGMVEELDKHLNGNYPQNINLENQLDDKIENVPKDTNEISLNMSLINSSLDMEKNFVDLLDSVIETDNLPNIDQIVANKSNEIQDLDENNINILDDLLQPNVIPTQKIENDETVEEFTSILDMDTMCIEKHNITSENETDDKLEPNETMSKSIENLLETILDTSVLENENISTRELDNILHRSDLNTSMNIDNWPNIKLDEIDITNENIDKLKIDSDNKSDTIKQIGDNEKTFDQTNFGINNQFNSNQILQNLPSTFVENTHVKDQNFINKDNVISSNKEKNVSKYKTNNRIVKNIDNQAIMIRKIVNSVNECIDKSDILENSECLLNGNIRPKKESCISKKDCCLSTKNKTKKRTVKNSDTVFDNINSKVDQFDMIHLEKNTNNINKLIDQKQNENLIENIIDIIYDKNEIKSNIVNISSVITEKPLNVNVTEKIKTEIIENNHDSFAIESECINISEKLNEKEKENIVDDIVENILAENGLNKSSIGLNILDEKNIMAKNLLIENIVQNESIPSKQSNNDSNKLIKIISNENFDYLPEVIETSDVQEKKIEGFKEKIDININKSSENEIVEENRSNKIEKEIITVENGLNNSSVMLNVSDEINIMNDNLFVENIVQNENTENKKTNVDSNELIKIISKENLDSLPEITQISNVPEDIVCQEDKIDININKSSEKEIVDKIKEKRHKKNTHKIIKTEENLDSLPEITQISNVPEDIVCQKDKIHININKSSETEIVDKVKEKRHKKTTQKIIKTEENLDSLPEITQISNVPEDIVCQEDKIDININKSSEIADKVKEKRHKKTTKIIIKTENGLKNIALNVLEEINIVNKNLFIENIVQNENIENNKISNDSNELIKIASKENLESLPDITETLNLEENIEHFKDKIDIIIDKLSEKEIVDKDNEENRSNKTEKESIAVENSSSLALNVLDEKNIMNDNLFVENIVQNTENINSNNDELIKIVSKENLDSLPEITQTSNVQEKNIESLQDEINININKSSEKEVVVKVKEKRRKKINKASENSLNTSIALNVLEETNITNENLFNKNIQNKRIKTKKSNNGSNKLNNIVSKENLDSLPAIIKTSNVQEESIDNLQDKIDINTNKSSEKKKIVHKDNKEIIIDKVNNTTDLKDNMKQNENSLFEANLGIVDIQNETTESKISKSGINIEDNILSVDIPVLRLDYPKENVNNRLENMKCSMENGKIISPSDKTLENQLQNKDLTIPDNFLSSNEFNKVKENHYEKLLKSNNAPIQTIMKILENPNDKLSKFNDPLEKKTIIPNVEIKLIDILRNNFGSSTPTNIKINNNIDNKLLRIPIPTDGPNDSSSESDSKQGSSNEIKKTEKARKKKTSEVEQLFDSLTLPPMYGLRKCKTVNYSKKTDKKKSASDNSTDQKLSKQRKLEKSKKLMVVIPPNEIKLCQEFQEKVTKQESFKKIGSKRRRSVATKNSVNSDLDKTTKSTINVKDNNENVNLPLKPKARSKRLASINQSVSENIPSFLPDIISDSSLISKETTTKPATNMRSRSRSVSRRNNNKNIEPKQKLFEPSSSCDSMSNSGSYTAKLKDSDESNTKIRSRSRSLPRINNKNHKTSELPSIENTKPVNNIGSYNTRSRSRSRLRTFSSDKTSSELDLSLDEKDNCESDTTKNIAESPNSSISINNSDIEIEKLTNNSKTYAKTRSCKRRTSTDSNVSKKSIIVLNTVSEKFNRFEPYTTQLKSDDSVSYATRTRSRSVSRMSNIESKLPRTRSRSSSRSPKEKNVIDSESNTLLAKSGAVSKILLKKGINDISSSEESNSADNFPSKDPKSYNTRTRSRSVCGNRKEPEGSKLKNSEQTIVRASRSRSRSKPSCNLNLSNVIQTNLTDSKLISSIRNENNTDLPKDSVKGNISDNLVKNSPKTSRSIFLNNQSNILNKTVLNPTLVLQKMDLQTHKTFKSTTKSIDASKSFVDTSPPKEKYAKIEESTILFSKAKRRNTVKRNLSLLKPVLEKNQHSKNVIEVSQKEACISIQCSSSSDDVSSPTIPPVTKMETSPIRKSPKRLRRRNIQSSPKYSPLNVIVTSPKKKTFEDEIEALKKKSKNFNSSKLLTILDTKEGTKKKTLDICSDVGELEPVQMLENQREEKMDHENKIKTSVTLLNYSEKKNCDTLNQNATAAFTKSDNLKTVSDKVSSIKKKLYFSTDTENSNVTIVEENKLCTYKQNVKSKRSKKLRNKSEQKYRLKEENFLKELEGNINNLRKQPNGDIVYNLKIKNRNMCNPTEDFNSINISVAVKNSELQKLTLAEQYDIKNNYIPKASCSKTLDDNDSKLSHNKTKFTINETTQIHSSNSMGSSSFNTNSTKTNYPNYVSEFEPSFKMDSLDQLDFSSLVKNPEFISKQIEEYKLYNKSNFNVNVEKNQCSKTSISVSNINNLSSNIDTVVPTKIIVNEVTELNSIILAENTILNCNTRILIPKHKAPTFAEIQSTLSEYNIPQIRFELPFYSDPTDVTGKIDVGHNVLKIPSKTTTDLEEFNSCIDFCGLENWRKIVLKDTHLSVTGKTNLKMLLAGSSECVITPSILPPTRKEVKVWLKSKVIDNKKENEVKIVEKSRIYIPMSPGNESLDETMTMSPCSPMETTLNDITANTTPTSTISPSLYRRGIKKRKGDLQRKALFAQTILTQKSVEEKNTGVIISEDSISLDSIDISSQKSLETNSILNKSDELKSLDYSKLKPSDLNLTESPRQNVNDVCQITGILDNTHGFKMSYENLQEAKALALSQNLTVLVVEIHTQARGDLNPDPDFDSIRAIFYSILSDSEGNTLKEITGIIAVDTLPGSPNPKGLPRPPILEGSGIDCEITYTKSELELIDEFVKLIRKWDPDIFAGYEIELCSWGYIIERAYKLSINLPILISRLNPAVVKQKNMDLDDKYELKIPGRIVLDIWRLLRHEIALQSYTFENIMYHVLHQRVPLHTFKDLSFWWEHRSNLFRHITANYYITRVEGILKILDQLDLIGRTSELAKLFGIQFYEVLSRGSQFRVESLMLRLCKPQNYIPVSPSVQQRAKMRAPEFLPLILEPESRLYTDPVIVLDFQSLYPSIIIAYNYCFSTCIGRVEKLGTSHPFEFGATQLKISPSKLEKLNHKINFSPCGVGYVRPEVRKGILPRMLQEILETRLMVKNSMKENKDNKILQRVLHSRQLGLKLIANVTYGYTAANFSGRMPCIEVGDSVVSKGRETLERAIKLIENNKEWGVRVVYGDTDSLFVLVPGRNREEAFRIGAEIADAVTTANPSPVKLKLEKIFQPCILQTKKRYVGYMYESADQKDPEYCAKGIETVRRDGCPAVAKMLEKCLRMLFESCDISLIKKYVVRQFGKILMGQASIQDLIFAKEYRGASGYRPGACVPALELAKKWRSTDKRKEPRKGQRVPYIIVNGPPGLPLIRLVRSPHELLTDPALKPNAIYYITKAIIPPVNRCFTLFGADLNIWFNEMPRKQIQVLPNEIVLMNNKKSTISQYFATMSCAVCGNQTRKGLCDICLTKPQSTVVALNYKLLNWERHFSEVNQICQSCCGRSEYTDCISLDCPVLYRSNQTRRDSSQAFFVRNLITNFT